MTDDADDAVNVAAVCALERAAVDVEQVHSVGANSKNIIAGGCEHGGDQGTRTNCFSLNYFLLAAAPDVKAASVVHKDDLLARFVDANLNGT